ncbi:MAG: excinuclease ABC subunit UvrC [Elusimicrobia bacterium]|nr:excinuclease ABC subunit UvrC [Candidatus Liberimonas magnetica]
MKLKDIPGAPGVYLMRDAGAKIIYVGKASNLKKRVASYFKKDNTTKISIMMTFLRHIDFILASSESEALIIENYLIKQYQPYFNTMWKDDKSYPYLKLTTKEDFPRLVLTRNKTDDGNEYFGPYPHVMEIKKLISWFYRFFKCRPCKLDISAGSLPDMNKVKSCIYLQSNKCPGPCVGKITFKDYRKKINEIKTFLKGRYGMLLSKWEKEMKLASKSLDYEQASEIRDRIKAIKLINEKVTIREIKPQDMSLSLKVTDVLKELKDVLGLKKWPITIEAFDISNISGTNSVGSLVRFHNAKPDKQNYRKFKIKSVTGANDTGMIKEVVYRRYHRLKAENRGFPDLILIDGGKGQLSSAIKSLEKLNLKIPVIALAKKEEELFLPNRDEPVKLDRSSKPLLLLQEIRDEAHRFAVSYHKLLREKI